MALLSALSNSITSSSSSQFVAVVSDFQLRALQWWYGLQAPHSTAKKMVIKLLMRNAVGTMVTILPRNMHYYTLTSLMH